MTVHQVTTAKSKREPGGALSPVVEPGLEAFGCSVCEIASAVGCSQATCHQLIAAGTTVGDGDGESEPVPWPQRIAGAENVARLLTAIVAPLLRVGVTLEEHLVNGRPGSQPRRVRARGPYGRDPCRQSRGERAHRAPLLTA